MSDVVSDVPSTLAFEPFPKIARLFRDCSITEKIDGTNACIVIDEEGGVLAGSRTRFVTPEDDNFGFAAWVRDNRDDLLKLGPGRHFGEWWGSGIQRGYGLAKGERRFSLFNVARWRCDAERPSCCRVVPTLFEGPFSTSAASDCIYHLKAFGSAAQPGFARPEGIIIWHAAARQMLKVTCEKDEEPKGRRRAAS